MPNQERWDDRPQAPTVAPQNASVGSQAFGDAPPPPVLPYNQTTPELSLLNRINSFVRNPFPAIGNALRTSAMRQIAPPTVPQFVPVARGDASLIDTAKRIGVDPGVMIMANAGITSAPVGSRVATRPQQDYPSGGGGSRPGQTYPSTPSQNASTAQGRGKPLGGMPYQSVADMQAELSRVNLATSLGQPVTSISFGAAQEYALSQGQQFSPDVMRQAGYTPDFISGKWVLNVASSTFTASPIGAGGSGGYGPGHTYKGKVIRNQGQIEKEFGAAALPLENAGGSPQTVLSLRLGSG